MRTIILLLKVLRPSKQFISIVIRPSGDTKDACCKAACPGKQRSGARGQHSRGRHCHPHGSTRWRRHVEATDIEKNCTNGGGTGQCASEQFRNVITHF